DGRRALDAEREHVLAELREMREILGLLARRQDDRLAGDAGSGKAGAKTLEMKRRHMLVGDDDDAFLPHRRRDERAGLREQLSADDDVVAARAEGEGQALRAAHDAFRAGSVATSPWDASAAMTRSTVVSGGPSMLSTVTSASA